jgi:hypothetical protein
MGELMTPDYPRWESFIDRLSGIEGINARLEGDSLKWNCDQSGRDGRREEAIRGEAMIRSLLLRIPPIVDAVRYR